jgi:type III secretion protein V
MVRENNAMMRFNDVALPLVLLGAILCIVTPLPGWSLDLLLSANLIFAVVLFAGALHMKNPLEFTVLPSVLLLAALGRLCLNLATTRAILSEGNGGELVKTFGSFVVGGNLVVGLVLFLLTVIVQFVVVAKGSERVAEVSARFTLDALPGKQMSIDADVRAGLLDMEGARKKRNDLQTESRFYGALDGAMKFVKGDAIAGILITAVNLLGGIAIGVLLLGQDMGTAARTFSLLSVGDGLLSQIPSLLNAVAAGLIVTRVGREGEGSLAGELRDQVASFRLARGIAAVFALILAVIPGMPKLVLIGIALLLTFGMLVKAREKRGGDSHSLVTSQAFTPQLRPRLTLEVSQSLLDTRGREIFGIAETVRQSLFDELGVLLEPIAVAGSTVEASRPTIKRDGIPESSFSGEVASDQAVRDWLIGVLRDLASELIDDTMTRRLLELVERKDPELVASATTGAVTISQVTGMLRNLLRDGLPVISIEQILQAIADQSPNPSLRRVEGEVRIRFRKLISRRYAADGVLRADILSPVLELAVSTAETQGTMLHPKVYTAFSRYADLHTDGSERILVCTKSCRAYVRDVFVTRDLSSVVVLAREEFTPDVKIVGENVLSLNDEESEREVLDALAA